MSFVDNSGIDDTKASRQAIMTKANVILNSMLSSLGSIYVSSNAFPLYAVQLKALAIEAARILVNGEAVYNDLIFKTTRPEFFYQNIETFLFFNQSFAFGNMDDVAARSFLLALIKAYFKGATLSSIETAIELAVEGQAVVQLQELYLQERQANVYTSDTATLNHVFLVSILAASSSVDIITLQSNIAFLTSLIKPAHTHLTTRFIFTDGGTGDGSGGWGGPCLYLKDPITNLPLVTPDGFEVAQKTHEPQICDTLHFDLFNYGYEDYRDNCFGLTDISITNEPPAFQPDAYTITTRLGPIGNGHGGLIDNVNQVTVTVNGNPVAVQNVNALTGVITLVNPIPSGALVLITYSYLTRYVGVLTTNNPNTVINQFDPFTDSLPSFGYSSVIWAPVIAAEDITPVSCQYKYQGYDGLNSSLLNDIQTLVFNKVGNRNKLNDYSTFESYNYQDSYFVTLNYGVPLFVIRQEKSLISPDSSRSVFRLNDPSSRLNSLVYNILGGTLAWQVTTDVVPKVYADLEFTSSCTGTRTDVLKPACESGLGYAFSYVNNPDVYRGIAPSHDDILVTNNTGFTTNRFVLYVPRTGLDVSFSRLDLNDLEIEAPFNPAQEVASGFHQAIDWTLLDYKTIADDYLLSNVDSHVIGTTAASSLLPPYPKFPVQDEFFMDINAGTFYDQFLQGRFCLNQSFLNHPDDPFGILRNIPGDCGEYIGELLLQFEMFQTLPAVFYDNFQSPLFNDDLSMNISGYFLESEPVSAFNDVFNYNLDWLNSEFVPVSGILDELGFGLTFPDTVQTSAITATDTMAISWNLQEGFPHGYTGFWPLFIANFAPIYDLMTEFFIQWDINTMPSEFFFSPYSNGNTGNVIEVGNTYKWRSFNTETYYDTSGSSLRVYKNGVLMINPLNDQAKIIGYLDARYGDPGDRYNEINDHQIQLVVPALAQDVFQFEYPDTPLYYRVYMRNKTGQTVLTVPDYVPGTNNIRVYRNGELLASQPVGAAIDHFMELGPDSIQLSVTAGSHDIFTVERSSTNPTFVEYLTGVTGNVLTIPNSQTYMIGDSRLRVFRNGLQMLNTANMSMGVPADRYQENTPTSVLLEQAATTTDWFAFIYK